VGLIDSEHASAAALNCVLDALRAFTCRHERLTADADVDFRAMPERIARQPGAGQIRQESVRIVRH